MNGQIKVKKIGHFNQKLQISRKTFNFSKEFAKFGKFYWIPNFSYDTFFFVKTSQW